MTRGHFAELSQQNRVSPGSSSDSPSRMRRTRRSKRIKGVVGHSPEKLLRQISLWGRLYRPPQVHGTVFTKVSNLSVEAHGRACNRD